MHKKTRLIAEGALLTALSLVCMALTAFLPTLQYSLVAIAGLLPAVMVIRYGLGGGFYVYASVSLLAVILLPDKEACILYIMLFGHYPMLKSLIERIRLYWLQWLVKLTLCNILLFIVVFLAFKLFTINLDLQGFPIEIFLLLANVVFILYDIGFSRLVQYFYPRLTRRKNGWI